MEKNENNITQNPHNIIMEQRSRLTLSGINEVIAFENENIELITTKGKLTIKGNNFKMESYQSEIGDLVVIGDIYALVYLNDNAQKQSFISRIFK